MEVDEVGQDLQKGQEDVQMEPLQLDILGMINDARNQHGLRHQDYQRYRQYCSRKIRRVRTALNLLSHKGNKRKGAIAYHKRPITAYIVQNNRCLEIVLFQAERAWSYAMQLKIDSADEPRKKHHSVKRMKRAVQNAALLEKICNQKDTEARTALEVQGYALLMSGYLYFEKQKWQQALEKFAASRTIYEKLLSASTASAEKEALCQSFIDVIDPNIRYCAYNLKLKGTQDIAALMEMKRQADGDNAGLNLLAAQVDEALAKSRHDRVVVGDGAATTAHTVEWRGKNFVARNPKFAEALLAAQEVSADLEKEMEEEERKGVTLAILEKRLEGFAKAVGAFWDATKIAEADVKADEIATTKIKTSKSDDNTANLTALLSYVSYLRLVKTIERNKWLQESLRLKAEEKKSKQSKALEPIKIYDVTLQTLAEINELPSVREDAVLVVILGAKATVVKAQRAIHLAKLHSQAGKHAEAIALYNRGTDYLTQAKVDVSRLSSKAGTSKKSSSTAPQLFGEDLTELKRIQSEIEATELAARQGKVKTHAHLVMHAVAKGEGIVGINQHVASLKLQSSSPTPSSSRQCNALIEHLDEFKFQFEKEDVLVEFPPKTMIPVAVKPFFFDTSFNYVEYDEENIKRRRAGKARVPKADSSRGHDEDAGSAAAASGDGDVEMNPAPKKTESSSSIGGFLSGIWGGRR